MSKDDKNWFHHAVGYQIYPKSFRDANADGIGDIQGMIEKLSYLKELGVDFLWINPVYKSPQVDGGYDISDYYAIDEMFGTLDDFKLLLNEAHKLGLKVIMDLVVNHTSNLHPWFIESQKSRENPYRDYYLWADATAEKMPNDWKSFFGGSTWTYDDATQQAYFHVFAAEQPDLNWKNPKLREEIYKMVRWWLELGLDGFRLDAISHIQKEPWDFKIKSWRGNGPWQPFMNVAGIENYMHELKAIFDDYGALTVGEASGVLSSEAANWTDENGYINMIFELEHNARRADGSGDIYGFKKVLMRWQKDQLARGWNALYLENHDQPRSIDAFGDGSLASAKALAVAIMLLRGTPFIYQGQEIGMTNFPFSDISQLRSAEVIQHYDELVAQGERAEDALAEIVLNTRDHSRTPMQWDTSAESGFTAGKPWMAVNPNYQTVNVEASQELLGLYKDLIKLRHDEKAISDGSVKFYFERHLNAFVYERDEFLIMVNLGQKKAHLDLGKVFDSSVKNYQQVLGSQARELTEKMTLSAWEYQVFKRK
ncbi:alpha-glucosidase [Lactococcus nasutitermitis]|uniref:Alpha-glucosidase n=1 Tax=Lactococcus nasutitermitis TaxID=1652957 RepID=A0ABV9JCR5_9LACT|nr:alpha-glucosidase [Lactococcus nasutitermitis]